MQSDRMCSHPGCDRAATEIAVVGSDREDVAAGSALFLCEDHATSYAPDAGPADVIRRVSAPPMDPGAEPLEGTTR